MKQGTFYHVYTHANGKENLFREDDNFRFFLKRYDHYITSVAHTYAYCLMPNHIHFLIQVRSIEQLMEMKEGKKYENQSTLSKLEQTPAPAEKAFQNLFVSYAKSYNKVYNRMGSLFVRPFKRKEVDNVAYFKQLIHYIHSNPVRHGFVKEIGDWRWSSYHAFLFDKQTQLRKQEALEWFGSKEAFLSYHRRPLGPDLTGI